MTMTTAERKEQRLRKFFRSHPGCLVALSGGVDSSYLALVAFQELGGQMLAVTGVSPSVPEAMKDLTRDFVATLQIPHRFVPTGELRIRQYRNNEGDRCYWCKRDLMIRLRALAIKRGFRYLIEGTQGSDVGDHRPGMGALKELKVTSPLLDLGFTKTEIRALARRHGIAHYDLPESACLASRVMEGTEVTRQKLAAIEEGEAFLKKLGFKQVRLRHHGNLARIEVGPKEVHLLLDGRLRTRVAARMRRLGFTFAALDLEGYKRGGGNVRIKIEHQ
jgi:pyridinium-3,5-biscarboxylic acid mononucleotide sulfurtransferase